MNIYKIDPNKRKFIEDNFFEWSIGRDESYIPSREDFEKLDHPAELHYLAEIYNWDDGHEVLEWILESPLCSKSTANLLFWRSLPSYFEDTNFNDPSTCPSYCEAGFELIKRILQKYSENEFSILDIEFNPVHEQEDVREVNPHWKVPNEVYFSIKGIKISV